tara:strand:+ start:239 stop:613 length:375 start_codon:yes stop_codon:yes gene_type:complete
MPTPRDAATQIHPAKKLMATQLITWYAFNSVTRKALLTTAAVTAKSAARSNKQLETTNDHFLLIEKIRPQTAATKNAEHDNAELLKNASASESYWMFKFCIAEYIKVTTTDNADVKYTNPHIIP